MTLRPRAVRALRDVRTRLRDAAAASHAVASAARDHSQHALVRERDRLEEFLDDAADVLAAAESVHDLLSVGDITGELELQITDAQVRHAEAATAAANAADRLRDRASALRRAEKLVERVDRERAHRESKSEQRLNDDLAGRRR